MTTWPSAAIGVCASLTAVVGSVGFGGSVAGVAGGVGAGRRSDQAAFGRASAGAVSTESAKEKGGEAVATLDWLMNQLVDEVLNFIQESGRRTVVPTPRFVKRSKLDVVSTRSWWLFGLALVACNDPEPKSPQRLDQVPANSLDDDKLHPKDAKPNKDDDDDANDPTQPLTTKIGDPAPADSASPAGKKGAKPGKGPVSKAECDEVMDKYLSLEVAGNPQLAGVDPATIAQAKQMMKAQHGDNPCSATRAQYTCAMGSTTTAAWQKCMK